LETSVESVGGQFELLLVNAQHIKQVPGRKTDLRDYLLQHNCPFRELGADHYQRLRESSLSQSLVRRLQRPEYLLTLTPAQQAI
jgi:hypothetical protein